MTRRFIYAFTLFGFCGVLALFYASLLHTTTNSLVVLATSQNVSLVPRVVYLKYLQHFRIASIAHAAGRHADTSLMSEHGEDHEPSPSELLRFTLNGCYDEIEENPYCQETVLWLLEHGADINEPSQDKMGLTPLHGAVLSCTPPAVSYLIHHGAKANSKAAGTYYPGKTAEDLVAELGICPQKEAILSTLHAGK